jgi:hypothetical protein
MTITANAGPTDALSILGHALSHYSAVKRSSSAAAGEQATPPGGALPNLSEPVQIYLLPLESIRPGFDLNTAARPVGWRYLVAAAGQEPILADIKGGSAPQQGASFGRINVGPVAAQLSAACETATELFDATDPEKYDVRLLDIPALNRQALWLHGPVHDHFLPYWPAPAQGGIQEDPQFLANLVTDAERAISSRPGLQP